jgi:GNAT superfamily N-acetyltransferase
MAAVIAACSVADRIERAETADYLADVYAHLSNCDPYSDMIVAEGNGEVIGYSRGWWWQEHSGALVYATVGFVVPEWRRRGIGRSLLRWTEDRLRVVAAGHDPDVPRTFHNFVAETEIGLHRLVLAEGYVPTRTYYEMIRPSLDDIPDFPLPEGFEIRPALAEHYRLIWDADVDAFREMWGFAQPTEAEYEGWLANKTLFQPELWQIAWHVTDDRVAGQVRTRINQAENETYGRLRGYTEDISVGQPYRRRGLARALIAASLRVQRDVGMTESVLGVDSDNATGAPRVYADCGFQIAKTSTLYRKPF